jgi:universal stress protein E
MRTDENDSVCVTAGDSCDKFSYQPIRRILCATDLSPRCEGAVRRAEMLAKQTGALLLLLHVVDGRRARQPLGRRAVEQARSKLEARQPTSLAEIVVRLGRPYRTIARVATKWDADLVVLGAYRQRFDAQIVGTTAERVIRTAKRAVLIVNGEPRGPYRDVLLAGDRPVAFAQVVSLAQQLGLLEGVRASIVQVLGNGTGSLICGAGAMKSQIDRYMQSMRQSSRTDLMTELDAAGLDSGRFTLIQRRGPPFGAIAGVIEEVRPELLVLGATRHPALRRVFGTSVANEVLASVDCDVFIASAAAVLHGRDSGPSTAVISHPVRDAGAVGWTMYW